MASTTPVAPTLAPGKTIVSRDKLTATLSLPPGTASISADDLKKILDADHIQIAADAFVAGVPDASGEPRYTDGMIVARGTEPVDDTPAEIRLDRAESTDPNSKERIDYRQHCSLFLTSPNQVVAKAVPYVKGSDGVDVFGKPVPHRKLPAANVTLGKNVAFGPDGVSILAQVAGELHTQGLKIWIDPRLEISGDVDFSVGNINYAGDVAIAGTVRDLFKVHVTGNLEIRGSVESAEVVCGGSLTVQCGIVAHGKGCCTAKGALSAKFISNAQIQAGGDISVRRELNNCQVHGGGKLLMEQGVIHGGHITLAGDLVCHTIGAESAVQTLVEIGIDQGLRDFMGTVSAGIETKHRHLLAKKQELDMMQPNTRNMTATQRAKMAELNSSLIEQTAALQTEVDHWRQRLAAAAHPPVATLTVQTCIHPGVQIHLGTFQVRISQTVKGPMKIHAVSDQRGVGLSATNPLTGSTYTLDYSVYSDPALHAVRQFLQTLTLVAPATPAKTS